MSKKGKWKSACSSLRSVGKRFDVIMMKRNGKRRRTEQRVAKRMPHQRQSVWYRSWWKQDNMKMATWKIVYYKSCLFIFSFFSRIVKTQFGWCCICYLIRNSLVALLIVLFIRISSDLRSWCTVIVFSVCARLLSLTEEILLSPLWTMLLCPALAIALVRKSYKCACVCAPLCVRVKMCD